MVRKLRRFSLTTTLMASAGWAALTACWSSAPVQARPGAATAESCSRLAGLKLVHVRIISAVVQPAKLPVPGSFLPGIDGVTRGPPVSGLPAFCRLIGHISSEKGSDIRFEVWMPRQDWNGRFTGAGNGGFGGRINYVDMANAIEVGQASASTDTGHDDDSMHSAWARGRPERVRDFGWRAMHLTTVNAKKIIVAYYGRGPAKSYFVGCSNGGRQALMEASRFPSDYDGIVAGAPASRESTLAMALTWTVQTQRPAGAALRPQQAKFLQGEVLKQCDMLDGQADGLIDDPRLCKIDTAKLVCGTAKSLQCLAPEQAQALSRIYAGPPKSGGRTVAFPYSASGAESGLPVPSFGWEDFLMAGGSQRTIDEIFSTGLLQDLNPDPFASPITFNWNDHPARFRAAIGPQLDAGVDMRRFFNRGGKLLIWHGWADAAVPPLQTIAYYEELRRNSGPRAARSVKLFMIPGMQHCFGGPGATIFGQFGAPDQRETPERNVAMAMQRWVEARRLPNSLVGRKGLDPTAPRSANDKERLHCAYPARAALISNEDPDKAASYVCKRPQHPFKRT